MAVMCDLSKVKPMSLSITVGWEKSDTETPWGFKTPVSHRFSQEELDAYWEANVASNYTLDAGDWYAAKEA